MIDEWRTKLILAYVIAMAFLSVVGDSAQAQEKSVNPGISESFQNPDAGAFVERFEREGREVYAFSGRNQLVKRLPKRWPPFSVH